MLPRNEIFSRFLVTVRQNKYILHQPTERQALFLLHDHIDEILFGGAAGGGKSDALLMASLQYVDVPGYSALILRRTYKDLALPDAIMDRSLQWLSGTDAHWNDDLKTWTFPSGATLTFGYLEGPRDKYRYQSAAFQYVAFDELTQFSEDQYRYLHSRLRRLKDSTVPIRMRAASNPGGIGHEWVNARFVDENTRTCMFIPSKLEDNPYLDKVEYTKSLMKLDPVTRAQLLDGDWTIRPEGSLFKEGWFQIIPNHPPINKLTLCRYWDKAASEGKGDYTVGALLGIVGGQVYIINIKRDRLRPAGVESLIKQTAEIDAEKFGDNVMIRMEQEPGSAGVDVIDHYARRVLVGYNFKGVKTTGSKVSRAGTLATAAEMGNVYIVKGPWNATFLEEVATFPNESYHDDQIDAVSGAFNELAKGIRNPEYEVKATEAVAGSGLDQLMHDMGIKTWTGDPPGFG
jgi:predicted phage terminase large subunit-like protein